MRRFNPSPQRTSTVAVPSKPRRMTKASHSVPLGANGAVQTTFVEAWYGVPEISGSCAAGVAASAWPVTPTVSV